MFHRSTVTLRCRIKDVAHKKIRLSMPFWKKSSAFSGSCHYSILYTPLFDSLPTRLPHSSILYTPFFDSLPTDVRYSTHQAVKTEPFSKIKTVTYKSSDSRNTYINTYITHSLSARLAPSPKPTIVCILHTDRNTRCCGGP